MFLSCYCFHCYSVSFRAWRLSFIYYILLSLLYCVNLPHGCEMQGCLLVHRLTVDVHPHGGQYHHHTDMAVHGSLVYSTVAGRGEHVHIDIIDNQPLDNVHLSGRSGTVERGPASLVWGTRKRGKERENTLLKFFFNWRKKCNSYWNNSYVFSMFM